VTVDARAATFLMRKGGAPDGFGSPTRFARQIEAQ
jgi:hypothetical protein